MDELRLFGMAASKAFISGLYQADANVVSDECFGDWMKGTWSEIDTFNNKFIDDPFSVPTQEYMKYATNWMEFVTKNADKCQWKKITDDLQNWCLDNKETCLLGKGLEKRIWDNATGIVTALADIFKMMEEDDTCSTMQEEVATVARLFKNYGELAAHFSGFDTKWDQSMQPKHIKASTFQERIDEFWATTSDMTEDMLDELQFPELTKIFNDLGKMFDDIFGKIDGAFDFIFSAIDSFFSDINKSLTQPIHIKPQPRHATPAKVQPVVVHHEEKKPAAKPHPQHRQQHHHEYRPENFWGQNDWWGNFNMPQWEAPKPQNRVIHTLLGDLQV